MSASRSRAVVFGLLVHLARLGVILVTLELAALVGISGWYLGLVTNIACVVFAVVLVSRTCGWSGLGLSLLPRKRWAWAAAAVLLLEVLLWTVPDGLAVRPPGLGLWVLTLLLVGINEELVSRGAVLSRMHLAFPPAAAAALTAALFGLQHLSALVTTSRGVGDVLGNVAVSACYGFALAAFQLRFVWITALVLLHAGADLTTILSAAPHGDVVVGATCLGFVILGVVMLRTRGADRPRASDLASDPGEGRPDPASR